RFPAHIAGWQDAVGRIQNNTASRLAMVEAPPQPRLQEPDHLPDQAQKPVRSTATWPGLQRGPPGVAVQYCEAASLTCLTSTPACRREPLLAGPDRPALL